MSMILMMMMIAYIFMKSMLENSWSLLSCDEILIGADDWNRLVMSKKVWGSIVTTLVRLISFINWGLCVFSIFVKLVVSKKFN